MSGPIAGSATADRQDVFVSSPISKTTLSTDKRQLQTWEWRHALVVAVVMLHGGSNGMEDFKTSVSPGLLLDLLEVLEGGGGEKGVVFDAGEE